jgi:Mce-associated membrane protein
LDETGTPEPPPPAVAPEPELGPPETPTIDPNVPVRRGWYRRAGGWLLHHLPWILFALALIAAAVFAFLWQLEANEDRERAQLEADARRFVTALTNFSSENILEDVEEIKSFAAPGSPFEEEADVFFGEQAIEAIEQAEAQSSGEIESLFVQSFEDDQASVFAVVNETVSNADLAEPRTDILRMNVELVKDEDQWKVSNVDVLQSPGSTLVPTPGP